jgi:hypothetical protein
VALEENQRQVDSERVTTTAQGIPVSFHRKWSPARRFAAQ